MNFTPNPANLLTGRAQPQQQQQQVHQTPVSVAAQSGSMQKSPNLPITSFPVQQAANLQQKVNNDNKMQPTSVHQQPAQNNNNHGSLGGSLQQLMNTQNQAGVNRNVNISQQASYQQSQPHISMPTLVQSVAQKTGSLFHQIQQMGYQSQQFHQTTAATQPQHVGPIHHGGMASQQSLFQKLPPNIPQTVHTIKHAHAQQHIQQQTKPVSNQLPPSASQQSMQYSPSKSVHPHPQMKTTAKLASPGSQLQSLQKSPTAQNAPQPIGQQAVSQNKNVPSTPPVSSSPPSVGPVLNTTTAHSAATTNTSLAKTVATTTIVKPGLSPTPSPLAPVAVSNNTAVPLQSVTTISPLPVKQSTPAPVSAEVEQSPTKTVEQSKEQPQIAPSQNNPVPKISIEEKSPVATPIVPTTVLESKNKIEKSQAQKVEKPAVVVDKQPAVAAVAVKPTVAASSPSKSTMRLATVTPARQKKPPATNNKKPLTTAPVSSSVSKTPVPASTSPAKPVEAPKTPSGKKPPTPSAVVVTPKSTPAQIATSPQPSSSSKSVTTPKTKRSRVKAQPYQCPTPELALVTKLSTQAANSNSKKRNDEKLTIFYKNEFLAVRNSDGGFFLCQSMQNVYKSSPKIHIRWLDERNEGAADTSDQARTYDMAFFDTTDFECVLTTVELDKIEGKIYELPKSEQTRIESILKKAIDVEKGIVPRPAVTEENPDGLDLSLYKDEAQLDKASPNKRKRELKSEDGDDDADEDYEDTPRKKKILRREPASKSTRVKKLTTVNDESTESDEENLMEIKNKAKKQAASSIAKTPIVKKAPEPKPSTSKASATPAKGRKRGAASAAEVEIPAKVANVEKVEAVKESPVASKVKAQATKKLATPKISPRVAADPKPEKKSTVKKVLQPEETIVQTPATTSPKVVEKKSTKAIAKKKPQPKAKASPAAPVIASTSEQQPSTSRSRNTRSKK